MAASPPNAGAMVAQSVCTSAPTQNVNLPSSANQSSQINSHLSPQVGIPTITNSGAHNATQGLSVGSQTNATINAPGQLGQPAMYAGLPAFPSIDMAAFQGVDWSSMYGMGMYV